MKGQCGMRNGVIVVGAMLLSACAQSATSQPMQVQSCASDSKDAAMKNCQDPAQPQKIGMPNPASVYCVKQGGKLEIRNGPDGQSGYCHLPDGRVVEEWALFRASRS